MNDPIRLGLFGGSFDPVHTGHLHVARAAQEAFGLDRVVFVPAARPPHKPGKQLAVGEDRLAMLALAIAGEPTWELSSLELERTGTSYTYDTIVELPAAVDAPADCELYVILGSDNLPGLPTWHRAAELIARAQPVVVLRDEADLDTLIAVQEKLAPDLFARIEAGLLILPPAPGRASDLRARLADVDPRSGLDPSRDPTLSLLPPGVWEYIVRQGIYK
ncbi:MAG: nicotinate (nicotinamide) nucleotide adenylyltransferase [bacterium]|nr:nicotinate (nicotinamide) nucleotide adenylyltransferase [bacterium]